MKKEILAPSVSVPNEAIALLPVDLLDDSLLPTPIQHGRGRPNRKRPICLHDGPRCLVPILKFLEGIAENVLAGETIGTMDRQNTHVRHWFTIPEFSVSGIVKKEHGGVVEIPRRLRQIGKMLSFGTGEDFNKGKDVLETKLTEEGMRPFHTLGPGRNGKLDALLLQGWNVIL